MIISSIIAEKQNSAKHNQGKKHSKIILRPAVDLCITKALGKKPVVGRCHIMPIQFRILELRTESNRPTASFPEIPVRLKNNQTRNKALRVEIC